MYKHQNISIFLIYYLKLIRMREYIFTSTCGIQVSQGSSRMGSPSTSKLSSYKIHQSYSNLYYLLITHYALFTWYPHKSKGLVTYVYLNPCRLAQTPASTWFWQDWRSLIQNTVLLIKVKQYKVCIGYYLRFCSPVGTPWLRNNRTLIKNTVLLKRDKPDM